MRRLALEGNIRVLVLQTLVSQLGFGMLYVVWQPYILTTGTDVTGLGVIQSVINLSTAAGLIAWGALSDRFGRKPVILASNAFRLAALAALIASGSFVFLIVFAFLMGFSSLFQQTNPARSALISESVNGAKRATAFSTILAVGQVTNTLTASAGGYLAIVTGYLPIFYVCILGDAAGLIILSTYLKETLKPEDRSGAASDVSAGGTMETVPRYIVPEKGLLPLYLLMLANGAGYGTGYSLFYGTLVDAYGFTPFQLGLLSTSFSLVWAVSSIPFGRMSDRLGRLPFLKASWLMALVTVAGFLLFRSFEAFFLFNMVSAFDVSFWLSAWTSYVAESTSSTRLSTLLGKLDSYIRLAGIPAPLLAGLLYSSYGFSAPLSCQLVCLVISGVLLFSLREAEKPRGQTIVTPPVPTGPGSPSPTPNQQSQWVP
jgi:MFS family permease